ncbi:hypothetical protein GF068_08620 [Polyangium spumosum]|uniref:Uncharacterized protein n=1 Tax=Polyangium spumosum TaxID=889282 RepID=A0A6N7PJJ1_9BACT|nr:hypothetical protein [Polyangium spumosum]
MDGVLRTAFGPLAEEMKDNLNQWDGFTLNLEETQLVETIRAFAGAVSAVDGVVGPYVEVMQTLVHATTRIGIGFVPYVGPALDLCEAVTGKRFCLPGGEELSTEERIFSGVGFGFGQITKAWAGIKAAGVQPGAKVVAAGIVGYSDEFLDVFRANRRGTYKGLSGAIESAKNAGNVFEQQAGIYLMTKRGHKMLAVGDGAVRRVLGIPPSHVRGLSSACDYISVSPTGKLVLSEVKGGTKGPVNVGKAASQLDKTLAKLVEKNLADSVERLQIIRQEGSTLSGGYGLKDGKLVDSTGKFVTMTGRPDLVVWVVEL